MGASQCLACAHLLFVFELHYKNNVSICVNRAWQFILNVQYVPRATNMPDAGAPLMHSSSAVQQQQAHWSVCGVTALGCVRKINRRCCAHDLYSWRHREDDTGMSKVCMCVSLMWHITMQNDAVTSTCITMSRCAFACCTATLPRAQRR